jgi:hypothetical protein
MYAPGICLEGLNKTTKNLIQDRRCLARNPNQAPPEYKYIESSTIFWDITPCTFRRNIFLDPEDGGDIFRRNVG